MLQVEEGDVEGSNWDSEGRREFSRRPELEPHIHAGTGAHIDAGEHQLITESCLCPLLVSCLVLRHVYKPQIDIRIHCMAHPIVPHITWHHWVGVKTAQVGQAGLLLGKTEFAC